MKKDIKTFVDSTKKIGAELIDLKGIDCNIENISRELKEFYLNNCVDLVQPKSEKDSAVVNHYVIKKAVSQVLAKNKLFKTAEFGALIFKLKECITGINKLEVEADRLEALINNCGSEKLVQSYVLDLEKIKEKTAFYANTYNTIEDLMKLIKFNTAKEAIFMHDSYLENCEIVKKMEQDAKTIK